MYQDHKVCCFTVNVPRNPVKLDTIWPEGPFGNSKIEMANHGVLTDEINDVFRSCGLQVAFVLLWTWNVRSDSRTRYSIHSDGDHEHPAQRNCAMNWVMGGESLVEWWSWSGARPKLTHKDDPFFKVTDWIWDGSEPKKIAEWDGASPAVLNIKQPHSVRVLPTSTGPRKSVTVRFSGNPSMEDLMSMLGDRVTSITNSTVVQP